jgi:hypothetical protein
MNTSASIPATPNADTSADPDLLEKIEARFPKTLMIVGFLGSIALIAGAITAGVNLGARLGSIGMDD